MQTAEKRLIDANKLNAVLQNMAEHCLETGDAMIAAHLLYCQEVVAQQRTVDAVEVVHGHWKYGTRAAICSECGFERHLDDNFGAAIACPNCAAKMDK